MEHSVRRPFRVPLGCSLLIVCFMPTVVAAQPVAPTQPAESPSNRTEVSRLWLAAGPVFATMRGDCQECEEDFPYRHAGSALVNAGYRVNDQMDVGAEVFWMPVNTAEGQIRSTHFDAVAQFRPWASKGFFLKGGAGMALIRNWVDTTDSEPINQKALSVVIGAGWAFRPAERLGFQMFGAQHVGALGDFHAGEEEEDIEDVVGNFWSLGIAIVIR
jgi:hypothetical protein